MITRNRTIARIGRLMLFTLTLLLSVGWISPESAQLTTADWIEVPVSGHYSEPAGAAVALQNSVGDLTVHTTDLHGELHLNAQQISPALTVPVPSCARIPFNQDLALAIDLAQGKVTGAAHGTLATKDGPVSYTMTGQGSAACTPHNGQACGQLHIDLEFDGPLSDPATSSVVGRLELKTRGTLQQGEESVQWLNLEPTGQLLGDAGFILSLHTMEDGESCGI